MTTARLAWRAVGAVVGVLAALGLRWSSVAPWPTRAAKGEFAQVRLSLSARPERVEQCRQLTDEELAKLPAHMRLRIQCDGFSASYRLTIAVNGESLVLDTLRGGGLRHDRPIHVFREYDVTPGEKRLSIDVARIDGRGTSVAADSSRDTSQVEADTLLGGRAEREREERSRRVAEAMPARLVLDTLVRIGRARVVLVTFDNNTRRLVARMER
jgi:hypothetical protein